MQEVAEQAELMIAHLGNEAWDGTLRPSLKQRMDQQLSGNVVSGAKKELTLSGIAYNCVL